MSNDLIAFLKLAESENTTRKKICTAVPHSVQGPGKVKSDENKVESYLHLLDLCFYGWC